MGACISVQGGDSDLSGRYHTNHKGAQAFLQGECKRDEALSQLATRVVTSGSLKSCSLHTQQGRKGVNQDTMIVWEEYMSHHDWVFCGVFDGHGPYGHLVAKRVRDSLPSRLANVFTELSESSLSNGEDAPTSSDEASTNGFADNGEGKDNVATHEAGEKTASEDDVSSGGDGLVIGGEQWSATWQEAHLRAYKAMDVELEKHPAVDCFCSGTTSVTVLKIGRHLISSNIGDSRCIIARRMEDGGVVAHQMSTDHKPDLPAEAQRIRQCRGRVFAMRDEPEIQRVWLPHDDSPGLAMARAFGDLCLKSYGVISEPKFRHEELTSNDLFAFLATDGVWDVLSNQEVVDLVRATPRERAARAVVEKASSLWRTKFPMSKTDDCAAVLLFFDDIDSPAERTNGVAGQKAAAMPRVGSSDSNSTSTSTPTAMDDVDNELSAGNTLRFDKRTALLSALKAKVKDSQSLESQDSGLSVEERWTEDNKFTRANSFVNLSERSRA